MADRALTTWRKIPDSVADRCVRDAAYGGRLSWRPRTVGQLSPGGLGRRRELRGSEAWIVAAIVSIALWVIQFFATVRTDTDLKKIVTLLEGEASMRFGAAQSLQRIQSNTEPANVDVLRSGI